MARKKKAVPRRPRRVEPGRGRSHPLEDLDEAEGLLEDLAGPDGAEAAPTALREQVRAWSAERMLAALWGAASAIAGDLDQRSLVRRILEAAIETMGAERGILFLGNGCEGGLVPAVALSITGEEIEQIEQVSRTILRRGQQGELVVSGDASRDPRFMDAPSVRAGEMRTVLCAPLVSRSGPLGVIYLDAPSAARTLPPDAGRFLEAFARLAAVAVENSRVHGEVVRENVRLRRNLGAQESLARLLSLSSQMEALRRRAAVAAQVEAPILIVGEPGTGKQMLARGIHEAGARALNPFIACDCGAMPRELIDAVLFGRVRGALPAAGRDMPGLLREADRGVLFLEGITELDSGHQERLLRALDEGAVTPVGGRREARIDLHLITAAEQDLRADVQAGRFLEALYYRISVLELRIPPLRERPEDIPLLVEHFLAAHAHERRDKRPVRFARPAIEYLQGLAWRGNARELESLVRRALIDAARPTIDREALERLVKLPEEGWSPDSVPGAWPAAGRTGRVRPFAEQEREALREALARAGGNKAKAARLLGLHRNTLLRRVKRLGVEAGD